MICIYHIGRCTGLTLSVRREGAAGAVLAFGVVLVRPLSRLAWETGETILAISTGRARCTVAAVLRIRARVSSIARVLRAAPYCRQPAGVEVHCFGLIERCEARIAYQDFAALKEVKGIATLR